MNPFAQALVDFHSGKRDKVFTIRRDDGFEDRVSAALFFDIEHYSPMDLRALDECSGSVLDIGSAAGRHSLELLRRDRQVTSLDILPETEAIMRDRGLTDVVIADVFQFFGRGYDTLLMLMNGIGMTGSIDGLTRFLQRAHDLIVPGGQIVCDSFDVNVTTRPQHVAYREMNLASGRPAGLQAFTMEYEGVDTIQFDWLHIDFQALAKIGETTGWEAMLLEVEDNGHYLCKLIEKSSGEQGGGDNSVAHRASP